MKKLTLFALAVICCYASFGQGYYFEMKMSSSKLGPMGTMKVYAKDGNSRSEMSVTTPMGAMDMSFLWLKEKPSVVYMLNESGKSYSEMDISKNEQWKDDAAEEYEIIVLGKEKVNSYNSIHVKIKHKNTKLEQEMWLSTEVANYATFMKAKTKFTGRENLYKALEAKGVAGFPVRIATSERGNDVQVDFVKAEKRENPSSLFSLDGYSKSAGPSANGNMQEMMQKVQSMTPEERKAFLEQMKQQYHQTH